MTDKDGAPEAEQAGDIEAIIDAAFDDAMRADEEAEGGAEEGAPSEDVTAEAAEEGEATEEQDGEEGEDPDSEGEPEEQPENVLEAPQDWRADQRESFAKLPPEAKELVLNQYKDFQAGYTRKSQELSEHARLAEAVTRELQPLQRILASQGMDAQAGVRFLAAQYANYLQNPAQFLQGLAQQAGIDPAAMFGDQEEEYIDPATAQLRQEVAATRQGLNQFLQQQEQQRAAQVAGSLNEFINAKDEAGNLLHPHVERLDGQIAALMNATGMPLAQAYQQAVRADPELHEAALKAAEARGRESVQKVTKAAVDKAKQAGAHKVTSKPPGKGEARAVDLDAILFEQMDRAGIGAG